MNKAELINKIASDSGISKAQASLVLNSITKTVVQVLKSKGKITIAGLGTFSVSKRAARNGRNPQTGELIKVKNKKVTKFKAGKDLMFNLGDPDGL